MKAILFASMLLIPASTMSAGIIFSEDFEGGSLAANWSSNNNGQIVTDPLNSSNHALSFSNTMGGGDLFSNVFATSSTYYLEFDYLYVTNPAGFGGGFVGVNAPGETWLVGDCNGCYPTYSNALNGLAADTWYHIQVAFADVVVGPGPIQLKLEQFQGTPGSALFDNITVSDTGFGAAGAPEPSSGILFASGIGLTFLARCFRSKRS
jgi:hypothetical protein